MKNLIHLPTLKDDKTAVVILSGGLDSTILTYLAHRYYGNKLIALSMDYNQRHIVELEKAKITTNKLNIYHQVLPINFFGDLVANVTALSNTRNVDMPNIKEVLGDPQPVTYVPFRNMLFLTLALSFAEANNAQFIYIGLQAHDLYQYWDTSPEFIENMNNVAKLNRKNPIEIRAPFVNLSKEEEINLGKHLNVPFEDTWTCFPPNTLVHTSSGLRPIETINVGDMVWSHTGILKNVTSILERDYNGVLYNIQINGTPTINCTPEHPIYTIDGFKQAKDINLNDMIPIITLRPDSENICDCFELTKDFALFLGLFAAEGCMIETHSGKNIDISLNQNELNSTIVQRCIEQLKTMTSNKVTIKQNAVFNNGINIVVWDVKLFDKLSKLLNRSSRYNNSWIFDFILTWDLEYQYEFLKGFFFGDGFYNKKQHRLEASCTNFNLINLIYNIFVQNNIYPRLMRKSAKACNGNLEQYRIRIPDYLVNKLIYDTFGVEITIIPNKQRKTLLNKFINQYGHRRINQITSNMYSGKVYNLSVEDQESYIVETVPVHNCYAGPEDGSACGTCPSCAERIKNFLQASVKDPIKYKININWGEHG